MSPHTETGESTCFMLGSSLKTSLALIQSSLTSLSFKSSHFFNVTKNLSIDWILLSKMASRFRVTSWLLLTDEDVSEMLPFSLSN